MRLKNMQLSLYSKKRFEAIENPTKGLAVVS